MRNLILIFTVLVVIVSCNKDNNSNGAGIVIKGRISQSSMKSLGTKSEETIPLSDAKRVFVVNLNNGQLRSEFIDITDGSFTATAEIGMAAALVFLDANNKYIGTLSTRGLNLLPLSKLIDGENTSIDLADLTLSGTSVIPSHDPFGNEIIITDAEINRLKEIDGFFESIAKNIDANNDGILDAVNNKQLFIKTRFWTHAANWGINSIAPLMSDIDKTTVDYSIELDGGTGFSSPASILLSGPASSPYNDISTQFINSNGNGGFYSGIRRSGGLFDKGIYTINIDGYTCTMEYSNNDADQNLMFVLPTLHTNSEGKVVSVSLEYKLADGSPIDPVNILTDIMIQFSDGSGNQYFNTPWIRYEGASTSGCNCVTGVFTFTPDSPVDISNLKNITIPYNDILGNTYFIAWSN